MTQLNESLAAKREFDCLLVDDEIDLSRATCEYFEMFGLSAYWANDVCSCMNFFETSTVDLILLDINLVDASGFDVCKRLRKITNVPIIFISARQSDDDRLLAFSIGGDDYIQKPYSLSVLLAKVKVVLSRYRSYGAQDNAQTPVTVGDLVLDEREFLVVHKGARIELKPMEFKLLAYLMKNKGRTLTKDELFGNVWKEAITSENTLNVHIRRLREKLDIHGVSPESIKTVWGIGYSFDYLCDNSSS